jgi:metal-responsive CopG/Arc/MetJ family transcriptional regulator
LDPLTILDAGYYRRYTLAVKTAVSIPGPLFQAAERLAKRLGMPRSRLYSRALEHYVAEAEERNVTALLNDVYAHETAELDSAMAALQSVSIPRERW